MIQYQHQSIKQNKKKQDSSMIKYLIYLICLTYSKFISQNSHQVGELVYASVGLTHMLVSTRNTSTSQYDYSLYNLHTNESLLIVSYGVPYSVASYTNSTVDQYWFTLYDDFSFINYTNSGPSQTITEERIQYVEYGETSEDRYMFIGSQIRYEQNGGGNFSYPLNGTCHEILYSSSTVYVLMEDGATAILYVFTLNLSFIRSFSQSFSIMSSFCVGENGIVHAVDNTIYIYQEDTLVHQAIFFSLSAIVSVSWVRDDVIVNGMGIMYQYRVPLQMIVHYFVSNIVSHTSLENETILGWQIPDHAVLLEATMTIVCPGGCASCPELYRINDDLECQFGNITVINETIINNTTNNSQMNNSVNESKNKAEEKYPDLTELMTLTGTVLIVSSWRVSLKFVVPFLWLLEEAWFYKFHQVKYPQLMQYFMYNIDLLNYYRLKPAYFDLDKVHISVLDDEKYNQLYYEYGDPDGPEEVYFLHATKDFYIWNVVMNLAIFIFLYILLLVFKLAIFICPLRLFKIIHTQIKIRLKWWMLILSLLESNSIFIVFHVSSQLLQPYSFDFQNKVNLVLASIIGFFIFISAIIFLPLIYRYCRHSLAQQILNCSDHSLGSFYLEMFLVLCRNVLKGFIHRFLIKNYSLQILSLFSVDILLVISVLYFRKKFHNLLTFLVYLLYACFFALFNITLYLRFRQVNLFLPFSIEMIIQVEIMILLGLVLIKMLLCLCQTFKGIHQVCRTNRIHPKPLQKKVSQELKLKESNKLQEINNEAEQEKKEKEKISKALEAQSIKTQELQEQASKQKPTIIFEQEGEKRIKKLPRSRQKKMIQISEQKQNDEQNTDE